MTHDLPRGERLLLSSGDLIADRRLAYAADYAARGEHAAAHDLLQQTLERAPDWAAAWFALGEACDSLGRLHDARAAFAQALACEPEDALGASLRLAHLGGSPAPGVAPKAYVARLFDDYAARFEAHLVGHLRYRGPQLLRKAVTEIGREHFSRTIDLGCGTGLCGEVFRPLTQHLAGVDLSARMIAQARAKTIYDRLTVLDIDAFLAAEAEESVDLLLAADVLVYIGDLRPLFAAAWRVLHPKGLFVFTAHSAARGVRLGSDVCYAHAPEYIRDIAGAAGFALRLVEDTPVRQNAGQDIPGLIVVLEK
jgi:predicted TPR repeat methyltransferase